MEQLSFLQINDTLQELTQLIRVLVIAESKKVHDSNKHCYKSSQDQSTKYLAAYFNEQSRLLYFMNELKQQAIYFDENKLFKLHSQGLCTYQIKIMMSREHYIREIASNNYDDQLSDLDNWLKAEHEFDYPTISLEHLNHRPEREITDEDDNLNMVIDNKYIFTFSYCLHGTVQIHHLSTININSYVLDYEDGYTFPYYKTKCGYKLDMLKQFLDKKRIKYKTNDKTDIVLKFLNYFNNRRTRYYYINIMKNLHKYKDSTSDYNEYDLVELKKLIETELRSEINVFKQNMDFKEYHSNYESYDIDKLLIDNLHNIWTSVNQNIRKHLHKKRRKASVKAKKPKRVSFGEN
uniref:Uncharacterized protein n=1 Tax=Megaviridae environmental sample TaxID=1737588 RepID=A0A5J6VL45_9VIRU|nr:MAG: hypothetical protein [Megaviridae environmental sample]